MAVLIFIGIFVARTRSRWQGVLIAAAAFAFLLGTRSKSPMQLLPVVLLVVWLAGRLRHPLASVAVLLAVPAAITMLTIGSVVFAPIREFVERFMSDPSFTGRDVIWSFAIEHARQRPWLGFGFQAFWGTSELVSVWNPQESWGYRASDAHNSFLNLAVMTGYIGMALALLWIIGRPLVDYVRSRVLDVDPALTALFIQIWLFGLCLSSFESVYFSGGSSVWFMIVVAIIGLRLQTAFQLRR
jgi:O-antigen ligase